jgi:hypothetical protein
LWVLPNGPDEARQILVPENPSFDDFTSRLSEAVRALASEAGESMAGLLSQLIAAASDVIYFVADHETPVDGSIPLSDGVALFDGIEQSLKASAKAAKEKRAYYGNRYGRLATAFLRRARLGQTETGSYVVKVLARVATPETAASGEQITAPGITSPERAIVFTLLRSFAATKQAIDAFATTGDTAAFYDAVSDGVSADMCDAIVRMLRADARSAIDVTARWSPLAVPQEDVPTEVKFVIQDIEPLTVASDRLKASEVVEDARVSGWVEGLSRSEEGFGPGVATIVSDGPIPSRGSRVRAHLTGDDYSVAIGAHESGERLAVAGSLAQEGNRYWLHNARLVASPYRPTLGG